MEEFSPKQEIELTNHDEKEIVLSVSSDIPQTSENSEFYFVPVLLRNIQFLHRIVMENSSIRRSKNDLLKEEFEVFLRDSMIIHLDI